ANVDVHVGRQRPWIVKSADSDEEQLADVAVDAPHRYPAGGAPIDLVWAAAVSRHCDRFGIAGQEGYSVGLDKRVEHERASGLPLAIAAMTAMYEHRPRDEPVAHRRTSASAFQIIDHGLLSASCRSFVASHRAPMGSRAIKT